ncbi:MAG TPA: type VI secretion system baseplate subunit TssE [Pyrinomonadaceae bacterium]|nr:type VI secretion system baseplate subunit TssE [Pyrinomonadaceae bacterium]
MRQLKPIAGARALLFDRLVNLHPRDDADERHPRILNREELKASVRRELGRLLNTRCSLSLHRLGEEERSVINYGIPDFSSLSAQNADDHALIASIISKTISAFEPRLSQVRVEVEPVEHGEGSLRLYVEGVMRVDLINEPVSFPVLLNTKNGNAQVNERQWEIAELLNVLIETRNAVPEVNDIQ